jgi:hypothetical protein
VRAPDYWAPILRRHRGPYLLLGGFRGPGGEPRTAWLKRRGRKIEWTNDRGTESAPVDHVKHDSDDVVGECYGYLREAGGPESIQVYSASEDAYPGINISREDACDGEATTPPRPSGSSMTPSGPATATSGTASGSAATSSATPRTTTRTSSASAAPSSRPAGRTPAAPTPAASSTRGGRYTFLKDADARLGTTPALVLATFKALGAATVAEVAAAIESSLTTADAKGLVASHATRLKAAGLLGKE